MNDLTVVLPVLNEEEGISAVIDELLERGYANILVIDGYSTDLTVQEARRRGATVIEQHGRGKTGAIQTAIENVKTPYMLIMDGDYTYDPDSIRRLVTHVNGYDQIVGVRSPENISWIHRLGNRMISGLFNALFGTGISDVCSGMYMLNSKSARGLEFRTKGFSVEVEVLAQMSLHGTVTEVPVHYRKRIGKPKLSTLVHGFDIMKSILGLARRYNPVFVFSVIAASAAIPGAAIVAWVLWQWASSGVMHSGWALAGSMLLLFATQAFIVGTVALLLKRTEIRMEHMLRRD
jgi:dolichol-phosphate mannosyltransferase